MDILLGVMAPLRASIGNAKTCGVYMYMGKSEKEKKDRARKRKNGYVDDVQM